MQRNYIVFCQEHYNPLGVIRSLGEAGIKPIVIVVKSKPRISSKSKYISQLHFVNTGEDGYELLIDKYSSYDKDNLPFIITCGDKEANILDMHYNDLKDKFIFFNAGEAGRITYYMDKENINELARKHGLNVAKTWRVYKGEIPDSIEFPIITKAITSNSGGGKKDVFICHSVEELNEAYKKILSEEVLLQKYITKKNELCLDGFSVNKGKNVFIAIGSNYEYILANEYSTYMNFFNYNNQEIIDKIVKMLTEIGFEGIFSIEFLIDQNDDLYFLEINFRNSTWSYAATCLGMNLPIMWSEGMLNGETKFIHKQIPENYKGIVEFSDFKIRVLGQKMNIFKWLSQCRKSQCKFYYNKKDRKPFWSFIFGKMFHRKKN